jgi:hypothetical protein
MENQESVADCVAVQVVPKFVETYILSLYAAAASFVPSAEEATENHCLPTGLLVVHVRPELVETYMKPEELPAVRIWPRAEEDTPSLAMVPAVAVQLMPELVET